MTTGNETPGAVPIVQQPLTWSSAIGLFLLNFGVLEMLVFAYVEKQLPGELEKWRGLHFMDRVTRLGKHFGRTPERQSAFDSFVQRLQPVRELRNHLAHGFIQIVEKPGDKVVVGVSRTKDLDAPFSAETRHVAFDELTAALGELNAITQEFQRLTDEDAGWKSSSAQNLRELRDLL